MNAANPIADESTIVVADAGLGLIACRHCGEQTMVMSRVRAHVDIAVADFARAHERCWLRAVEFKP